MPGLECDVMPFLDEAALQLLERYYRPHAFTGGRFEFLAGGGDRPEVRDAFVADDIVAVGLLSVTIPPATALQLLEDDARQLSDLLGNIPTRVDLAAPEAAQHIEKGSPADVLWHRLANMEGVAWVTAHKLLARKRPQLLPVYDRVVKAALQPTRTEFWGPLRETLQDPAVMARLEELRQGLGLEVSLLRVLDVAVWMRNWGTADMDKPRP